MDKQDTRSAGRGRRKVIAAAVLAGLGALAFVVVGHAHRADGPVQRDMAIDGAVRARVIDAVVAQLDRAYVFPDKAAQMHALLLRKLQHGDFDRITSAEDFADKLTSVLRDASHDGHMEVRYYEQPLAPEVPGQAPPREHVEHERLEQLRFNYGMAEVKRLQGNLGYIDLHQMGRPGGADLRMADAMGLLRDTQALVIDLRHCDGGDPDTVMHFASYLFDRPTHLNDVYWRDENRTEVRWTSAAVPGPRFGQARPVYVLTSHDTFSGCEDLAYALKNTHRAILVGETTGGGAHAGNPQRLDAHFMMFVPSGRPISPVTHTDWEGVGVVPDVPVSAGKASDMAQLLALRGVVAREQDADWKRRVQDRVDELE
jgi:hypothetical protein